MKARIIMHSLLNLAIGLWFIFAIAFIKLCACQS